MGRNRGATEGQVWNLGFTNPGYLQHVMSWSLCSFSLQLISQDSWESSRRNCRSGIMNASFILPVLSNTYYVPGCVLGTMVNKTGVVLAFVELTG